MITREQLVAQRDKYARERDEMLAGVHALSGAIQDCEHWLAVLDAPKTEEAPN